MIGQTVGNYRITAMIGEGGMGVVYAAEHLTIGRRAAVKILRPGLAEHVDLTRRFFNEARAANSIRHPGIVEVFDSGTLPSGAAYLVMELLEGESLAERIRRVGRMPPPVARTLAAETADVLVAAHAAGIVHRDLKPDNLFLVPDDRNPAAEIVKVLDFGIAKLVMETSGRSSVRTRTGSVMGTPAYMSPEQCRGTREVDHRADVYSLGIILYEAVCGRPPFVSEGFGEMVHLHISAVPPPPRSLNAEISEDLERIILACLAKEPAERVQTMAELQELLSGRPTPARRQAMPTSARPAAALPAAKTTFTEAAQASDLGTDVPPTRAGRLSAIAVALVAVGGVALWRTRDTWVPRGREAPLSRVPSPSAPPSSGASPAPEQKPLPTVTTGLRSQPGGARIVRETDGAVIGVTPFRATWPSAAGVHKLRVELDGYRPETIVVPLDRGVDIAVALKRISRPEPPKTKTKLRAGHPPTDAPPTPPGPSAPAPKAPAKLEPVPL